MNTLKKTISLFIIISIFMFSVIPAGANQSISVYLNGTALVFDVPPQIINGRTMVPMRKIFESLGAVVTWDSASQTATGKKDGTVVNVSIDSKVLFKNGVPKTLDVAPALIDSRTLVPVRAIAESFDCTVDWVAETQSVIIKTNTVFVKPVLNASEISERVSPSVFYIEVSNQNKKPIATGSGFFISPDGTAVTNYHVIEGSYSAQITTTNGEKYNVSSIVAYDEDFDVAIIKVDKKSVSGKTVSAFPSVTMADSDNIKAGQTIYALGSPLGLQNTISSGIISNVKQVIGEESFIQITAPISHGSSGGALVNEYGEVLGITSAGIDEAQNIGFAIPINTIKMFDITSEGIPYGNFESSGNDFLLEVYPESIEIQVGETAEILVRAEGKDDDWSIYWDTKEENIVSCEWGDWLESDPSVCPLMIKGLKGGTAKITVYSDVDFVGKDITVYVKQKSLQTYPSSCTSVPTYTAVTGVPVIDFDALESNDVYTYKYYDIDVVQSYVDYLFSLGYTFFEETDEDDSTGYMYLTPENKLIMIVLARSYNEVWIYIPR